MNIEEQKKCFVIMPFSKTIAHGEEYWTKNYTNFLQPLIVAAGLIPYRSSPLRNNIVEQIIKDLITAPIVVADLTDANPNVYWELGVRQSFKHGTVTIAQQGTNLPFDIGSKATLYYIAQESTDHTQNVPFVTRFTQALLDCVSNPESPDSVILQTITGRATLYQITTKAESLRKLTALLIENEYNCRLLDTVSDFCNKNFGLRALKREKACSVVTARMRLICLENLLVNRYLDTKDSFYEHAHKYYTYATAINEQLPEWGERPLSTEEWLSQHLLLLKPHIQEFNVLVKDESKHLSSIY
jgi:hypothetical protein